MRIYYFLTLMMITYRFGLVWIKSNCPQKKKKKDKFILVLDILMGMVYY